MQQQRRHGFIGYFASRSRDVASLVNNRGIHMPIVQRGGEIEATNVAKGKVGTYGGPYGYFC